MKKIILTVAIILMVLCLLGIEKLSVYTESGSSAPSESEAREAAVNAMDNDSVPPVVSETNTLYVKADTSGHETFTASEEKTIPHYIYWTDPNEVFGYFLMGYLKITFDPSVVEPVRAQSGAFSTRISRQGPGWIIVDPWMWYPGESDPNLLAFNITWRGLQAGTTGFDYTVTDSSGNYRGYFLTGTVHNMQRVTALVEFSAQPPATPSNLVATAISHNQINLTWQDNSDNENLFVVERRTEFDTSFTIAMWVSSQESSGFTVSIEDAFALLPDTLYYYRVRATNETGDSEPSNEANARTFIFIPSPSILSATGVSISQIDLSWQDNSNNELGFIIERSVPGYAYGFTPVGAASINATSYSDVGLEDGMRYYYRVKAYNQIRESEYSSETSGDTLFLTIDSLIGNLTYFYNNDQIRNDGLYRSLSQKLLSAKDALVRGEWKAYQNKMDAFLKEIDAQTGKGVEEHAAGELKEEGKTTKDLKPEIKGPDGKSPPPPFLPVCFPVTITGVLPPITGSWSITVTGHTGVEIKGGTSGTTTPSAPVTPTITVHAIQPSTAITDTIDIILTVTPDKGAPISSTPYSAPAISTTFITSLQPPIPFTTTVVTFTPNGPVITGLGIALTATGIISTTPTADGYCDQWEFYYWQTISSSTIVKTYAKSVVTQTFITTPVFDAFVPANAGRFTRNGEARTGTFKDITGEDVEGLRKNDPYNEIQEYRRDDKYALWFVAVNLRTGEIRLLGWSVWNVSYHVIFKTVGRDPQGYPAIKVDSIQQGCAWVSDSGVGQGPNQPVFSPLKTDKNNIKEDETLK